MRCRAVVNDVAKKIVSTRPSTPVAVRMSSDEANACRAVVSASPRMPNRAVTVTMIEARVRSGTKAATTITSGKNETNALPASATLRSTNSTSSKRSQTRQKSSRSSRSRSPATVVRASMVPIPWHVRDMPSAGCGHRLRGPGAMRSGRPAGLTESRNGLKKGRHMGSIVVHMSMSLDGFIAGPNALMSAQGLGVDGHRLHAWLAEGGAQTRVLLPAVRAQRRDLDELYGPHALCLVGRRTLRHRRTGTEPTTSGCRSSCRIHHQPPDGTNPSRARDHHRRDPRRPSLPLPRPRPRPVIRKMLRRTAPTSPRSRLGAGVLDEMEIDLIPASSGTGPLPARSRRRRRHRAGAQLLLSTPPATTTARPAVRGPSRAGGVQRPC